jgi:hypothetical protein
VQQQQFLSDPIKTQKTPAAIRANGSGGNEWMNACFKPLRLHPSHKFQQDELFVLLNLVGETSPWVTLRTSSRCKNVTKGTEEEEEKDTITTIK